MGLQERNFFIMDKLYSPTTIRQIKEKHGFKLSKSLGQNFLIDGNIVDNIIKGADISESDLVIEIGPGIGVLTAAAAQNAGKVIGVEIDRKLIPILEETLAEYGNVTILNQDILKTDLNDIIDSAFEGNQEAFSRVKIIGNLPYYITTPIIMKVLENQGTNQPLIDSITIMLQKEVADRIKAVPGSKTYGALSVAVQYYATVEMIAHVPKEVFTPRPKVDSCVIRLFLRKEPPVDLLSREAFFAVVKAGFGQRRKTLLNALTGVYSYTKEEAAAALEQAGIEPQRRAETLDQKEFALLSNAVFQGMKNRKD
jgi:16S rRNA (adenine1518-N6/adenine1519-N6)-dimethyltransferase